MRTPPVALEPARHPRDTHAAPRRGGPFAPALSSRGALFTVANPYLSVQIGTYLSPAGVTVSYAPSITWRTAEPMAVDLGVLGLHALSGRLLAPPADPLDESEQTAMVSALRAHLVTPPSGPTVKLHVPWTENDYQLDIALAADRAAYKRIIDRAAQMGVSHVVFAPRNSDVSCKRNNSDAWGWEQLLWFGMGQRLRLGEWTPADPLPPSLAEMLAYFASRRVRPVAYVYPILGFLAGTYPNGTNPPWIVHGTYAHPLPHGDGEPRGRGPVPRRPSRPEPIGRAGTAPNGPLRSCLASPELQRWLPETLLSFARATGAGGFSFDYTYL